MKWDVDDARAASGATGRDAHDRVAELEAEVTRLREALEEMTAYASSPENPLWDAGWQMGHRRGQAEKRAAEKARDEAQAALRPFATSQIPEHLPDKDSVGIVGATIGDYRHARAVLDRAGGK